MLLRGIIYQICIFWFLTYVLHLRIFCSKLRARQRFTRGFLISCSFEIWIELQKSNCSFTVANAYYT